MYTQAYSHIVYNCVMVKGHPGGFISHVLFCFEAMSLTWNSPEWANWWSDNGILILMVFLGETLLPCATQPHKPLSAIGAILLSEC